MPALDARVPLRSGARVAASLRALPGLLRAAWSTPAIVSSVDNVLNPRTHLRRTADSLQHELARLVAEPTADDRRAAELRSELRLVEAELAALERHHRRRSPGR